jgi:two-component system, OmpR family, alkaline phosphatase synthesis response regulator PhoP
MSEQKILLVDDDPDILDLLGFNLAQEGFQVEKASNGADAVEKAVVWQPDLVLMDVMMPVMDGVEACHEMRKRPQLSRTAIAFLTARNEDYSQIAGFDAGADDYIEKPIKPRVLISRIKALLRRNANDPSPAPSLPSSQGIVIDRERYMVYKDGNSFSLPRKEFELLALLASKPGRVFTRENILDSVWGNDVIVGDRTIDVHIRKLREKLGDNCLKTIKGVGYKFEQ